MQLLESLKFWRQLAQVQHLPPLALVGTHRLSLHFSYLLNFICIISHCFSSFFPLCMFLCLKHTCLLLLLLFRFFFTDALVAAARVLPRAALAGGRDSAHGAPAGGAARGHARGPHPQSRRAPRAAAHGEWAGFGVFFLNMFETNVKSGYSASENQILTFSGFPFFPF